MKGSILEVQAQRERWVAYRQHEAMVEGSGEAFAQGGLGGLVEDLDVRLLLLPTDPLSDSVSLDGGTLDWLKEQRESPYGGGPVAWGHRTRSSSSAVVVYDQYRDDSRWDRYLALHRHGGIEFGSGSSTYQTGDTRVFALRQIIGLAWSALATQVETIDRWTIPSPFELTVALRNTNGATLGSFAEGWREPGQGLHDIVTCIEEHVFLRWEFVDGFESAEVALNLGDRLEQAFGTTHRRHLAHRGQYQGQFDPRFGF